MSKISILIIEDSPEEAALLMDTLEDNQYCIAGVANNFQDALKMYYELSVDLVIIDVFLRQNPDGITFAETISIVPGGLKPFVFLTSSNDRKIFERAKLTKPFSFLLKPFNELELLYALEIALEKFYEQHNVFSVEDHQTLLGDNCLFIKKKNALKKVMLQEIIYIEVENRYCSIITENEKFVIQSSLEKIGDLLADKAFFRTHRSYMVNAAAIEQIVLADNLVVLKGGHHVTISGKYKDLIKNFKILK